MRALKISLAAIVMAIVGGALAVLIRQQLAYPEGSTLAPETYMSLVTIHGTIMVFFVVMPALKGRHMRQLRLQKRVVSTPIHSGGGTRPSKASGSDRSGSQVRSTTQRADL